jgi:copper oxidase (laccase) domain-containing protein
VNDSLPPPAPSAPIERFRALEELGFRHGFIGRAPGVDVDADRAAALARLDGVHREARRLLGLESLSFLTAEQVHGNAVAVIEENQSLPAGPVPGVDGLLTRRADVCLGIYVADCCAVYLVDPVQRVIGLVHAGKKGAELGIVPVAIETMVRRFGVRPEDLLVQLSPCIRVPHYEVDFPAQIIAQCRALGVGQVEDCGACTAADPVNYYSYRREKGRTGRMLALLAATK